jgi:general secretion pathway protein B
MSYILEALKKSEARRRSGQAPDISQATPQAARRSRRWPLVLVTVVVLGAGSALGVWLAMNRDADSTLTQGSEPASKPEVTEAARDKAAQTTSEESTTHVAIADRVRRAAGKPAPSGPDPAPGKQSARRDEGAVTETVAGTATGTHAIAAPAADTPVDELADQLADPGADPGAEPEPGIETPGEDAPPPDLPGATMGTVADADAPPNPLDELTALAGERLETGGAPEAEEPRAEEPGPPLIHELAWGFRSQLPPLALNVHMYSDDPAQRFVLINMQRYNEGDVMEDSGIEIVQVIPEGVALRLAGRDFLLGR